jgi:tetratricopeptide (TPR) repeat protein
LRARSRDALKLQDAIAAGVVRELQPTVASGTDARVASKNPEAYDLYLRARHAVDRTDRPGAEDAITLLQQTIDHDPTFADAFASLGYAYVLQVEEITATPAVGCDQARRAAQKAVDLDSKNARGRVVIAQVDYVCDRDWLGAERILGEAAALSPRDVDVLAGQAAIATAVGRREDALRAIKASLARDPLNTESLTISASAYWSLGRLDVAEEAYRRALEIRPNIAYGHYNLAILLLARADAAGALREIQQEANDDGKREGLALVNYAMGKKAESDAALADMLREDANASAVGIAEVYAFRGQLDEAMHWLERACSQKDPYLYLINGNSLLKHLEGDPRYKAFLKKMNFPET